jgi:uncharacterized cupredoxin-like copper-binding protein
MRKPAYLIGIVMLTLLAACSSGAPVDDHDDDHGDEVRIVNVMLDEFGISDLGEIEEGETIQFEVMNMGAVAHEFEITNLEMIAGHGHDDGHDGMEMEMSKISVAPGAVGTLTVTFDDPAEQTLAVCLLPGHYEAGMMTATGF